MRPIHSLEDLREAKKELAIQKKLTQSEFVKHVDTLRNDAGKFVVKKVVLPLGIGVATAFALKFFFFDQDWKKEKATTDQQQHAEEEKGEKSTWLNYFSILLSLVKIIQSAMAQHQQRAFTMDEEEESGPNDAHHASPAGSENMEEEVIEEPISPKSFVQQFQQQKAEK